MRLTIILPEGERELILCDTPMLVELDVRLRRKLKGLLRLPDTLPNQIICNKLSAFVGVGTSDPGFHILVIESAQYLDQNPPVDGIHGFLQGRTIMDNRVPFVLRW